MFVCTESIEYLGQLLISDSRSEPLNEGSQLTAGRTSEGGAFKWVNQGSVRRTNHGAGSPEGHYGNFWREFKSRYLTS